MQYPNWHAQYAQWFFEHHLLPLAGRPNLNFLQIGVFTGDASVWLLENVLTGPGSGLVDVDTWEGSDEPEHEAFDWADVEQVYWQRMQGRAEVFKGTSTDFFGYCVKPFDFIYIDGDHTAVGVLEDAVDAYRWLKPGGLLAFDDYLWASHKGPLHSPAPAIAAVQRIYAERLEVLEEGLPPERQAQRWFRKIA